MANVHKNEKTKNDLWTFAITVYNHTRVQTAANILLERRKRSIIRDLHRLQCSEILKSPHYHASFLFDDVIADINGMNNFQMQFSLMSVLYNWNSSQGCVLENAFNLGN